TASGSVETRLLIEHQTLRVAAYPTAPLHLSGWSFVDCIFDNCTLGPPRSPTERSYIGRIALTACRQRSSGLRGVVLDEVEVHDLGRDGRMPLFLSGVVFRHVRVSGSISFFKLNPAPVISPTPTQLSMWLTANSEFYRTVDWAIDISAARFSFGPDLH